MVEVRFGWQDSGRRPCPLLQWCCNACCDDIFYNVLVSIVLVMEFDIRGELGDASAMMSALLEQYLFFWLMLHRR